jgi:hypothetical protein
MTLDSRITKFVQDHPGDWQISVSGAQLSLPSSVLYVAVFNGHLTFGVTFTGGSSRNVPQEQLLERLARWEGRRIVERGRMVDCYPQWLVEPVRVELRRRANELLTIANQPTQSEMKQ